MKIWPAWLGIPVEDRVCDEADAHEQPDRDSVKRVADALRLKVKAHQLGRDYGRASATIHAERCQNALLREHITSLEMDLEDERSVTTELTRALDAHRPPPDRAWLGLQLEKNWWTAPNKLATGERWARVADTAIDAVRGLWPAQPGATVRGLWPAQPEPTGPARSHNNAAADDTPLAEWMQRLLNTMAQTGYCAALDGLHICALATDHDGDHETRMTDDTVHTWAPRNVAGDGEEAGGSSPPTGAPATGDTNREHLARVIARRDLNLSGTTWDGWTDRLRDYYLAGADDVINAGWRPPQLKDTDHVAEQLISTGDLA